MRKVTIHQAKTHLSRLLQDVRRGEEIVIAKGNEPIARLVPIRSAERRVGGGDQGLLRVSESFFEPLPDDVLADFGPLPEVGSDEGSK
ncbi:MAG: type II toxin-antitoxin system Phd/YefM family antitoxin [Bdellovibrionales bacterium]|nr:type II toxin-antitoxin system Phd/YefM family antitoxin [Bdellovibrionales bacterium]